MFFWPEIVTTTEPQKNLEHRPANGLSPSLIIGWCVLVAGIGQMPVIVAGLLTMRVLPQAGVLLLLLGLPSSLLLFLGGLALICRQFAGYYCVYVATFFAGIGGFKAPYIPFLKRFVNIGPATEDLFMGLNLVLVGILAVEHWRRIEALEPSRQKAHRIWLIALIALGLCSVSVGRAMMHWEKGEKARVGDLPIVGASLSAFQVTSPLPYVSLETKLPRGISCVFSGISTESAVLALAEAHHLKRMDDPKAHQKFLPQARSWKLDETVFPYTFSADDLYYVGRLKGLPKVVLELVYRKADGKFTAQAFGTLPKKSVP